MSCPMGALAKHQSLVRLVRWAKPPEKRSKRP